MTGICRGTCSIVGSILCVGLGQQRQPLLPQNQLILVYSDMQYDSVAFLESSNTMFSHTWGCNSQDVINTSWQQTTTDSWESVASFSRLLDFILHDSLMWALEIIVRSAVTPGGDEVVVYFWPWSLRRPEFCDRSAVCIQEQDEIHSWKVVFPGNGYHYLQNTRWQVITYYFTY